MCRAHSCLQQVDTPKSNVSHPSGVPSCSFRFSTDSPDFSGSETKARNADRRRSLAPTATLKVLPILVALFSCCSCGFSTGVSASEPVGTLPDVAQLIIAPTTAEIRCGGSQQFGVTAEDSRGNIIQNPSVTWSSQKTNVATINGLGLATGVSDGTTTITATAPNGTSALATVAVQGSGSQPTTLVLSPAAPRLAPGQTQQMGAVVKDVRGNIIANPTLNWSSAAPTVVTVTSSGLLTGVGLGNAKITATAANGISASTAATVQLGPPASVTLSPDSVQLAPGQTQQMTAAVKDAWGNIIPNPTLNWSSSAPTVATVNPGGLVTGVNLGAGQVTAATPNGISASAAVLVQLGPPASVVLSPSSVQLAPGQTQQMTAAVKDAWGNIIPNPTLNWSSSVPTVAAVNPGGLVTGVDLGSAQVAATASNSVSGSAIVTVAMPPIASVVVLPASAQVQVGGTQQFSATAYDNSGHEAQGVSFTWSSGDTSVATVDSNGLARGLSVGAAEITAETGSVGGSAELTVTPPQNAALFGLHVLKLSTPWPTIGFGALRLWGTDTYWGLIEKSKGVYNFTTIDDYLAELYLQGITNVVFTIGEVPKWASSNPNDTACDFASWSTPGGCDLPTDINADGSGTDQTYIDFVTALAQHVNDPTYLQNHAHIGYWEPWNEWYRNNIVNTYPWNLISLRATYAQMVRMTEDVRCVITGTGSVNGQPCAASAIDPTAKILSPSDGGRNPGSQAVFQNFLYCNGTGANAPLTGSYCTTGTRGSAAVDIINSHFYEGGGAPPEYLASDAAAYKALLTATDLAKPFWSGEGSWDKDSTVPDPDIQASWVARYYLVGWSSGFAQLYWYAYDGALVGTLWTSTGGLALAGQAYGTTYSWVAGSMLTSACSNVGTVWTCGLTLANGKLAEVIWDTSQTCSGGSCTSSNQGVSSTWTEYQDLTGTIYTIGTPGSVAVGIKPILLSSQ
jgi:uncharacterized protein YjdB